MQDKMAFNIREKIKTVHFFADIIFQYQLHIIIIITMVNLCN